MAKAHITTVDGTKITIEGSHEEVAALISRLKGGHNTERVADKKEVKHKSKTKPTPVNLISELIDGGFFKKPKELGMIKVALEEQGHFYPVTSLSPALLRLVRKRELRRIKDKKRWLYVG
ncbi:MAG: hypothetical protein PHY92_04390 [Alphaproteobacteria bacterium]|nr:hypothetical protein [Alphaproteobacteria bacterium]